MRVVVQRVKSASCVVNDEVVSKIEKGYLLLVGFTRSDTLENVVKMARKIANLRIFEDDNGKMNLNISQVNGEVLSISQFTLYANTKDGNRPSFVESMKPDEANHLYLKFNEELRKYNLNVYEGIFGENMQIHLINDGPVTINLEF
ncbi:MAG TPA: D-tyrosyl-tRNA(Tyr) deacylase [Acholeplasmataceae bacterium]|nr:D-tyrosyl-tRNA(Tyr) deacylase [Acholeplasmataceae bacterium]